MTVRAEQTNTRCTSELAAVACATVEHHRDLLWLQCLIFKERKETEQREPGASIIN